MEEINIPLRLILALVLGGVIGLEREINEKKTIKEGREPTAILGLRSFALMGLLGGVTGILYTSGIIPFALLIGVSFMVMLTVFYIMESWHTKDFGFTTELAAIFTFLIGALLTLDTLTVQIVLAMGVLLTLLLSRKQQIKEAVSDVKRTEVNAFISYAIIAIVILPFLPNESYSLSDVPFIRSMLESFGALNNQFAQIEFVNPFRLWLIVALITGVDIAGYVLERLVGEKRGWVLASIAGGFISSTATTQSLAQESKSSKRINHLVASALLANLSSFFQIGIVIAGVSAFFFVELIVVLIAIILTALIASMYFLLKKEGAESKNHKEAQITKHNIFNISTALKFAGLYLIISVVTKVGLLIFGQAGFLLTTGLGAVIGLDAVMINTATLAGDIITAQTAVLAFIIANAVNLFGKAFYSYALGKREFAHKFMVSVVAIVAASLLGFLFV